MQVKYRELPANREFGVELEVSSAVNKTSIAKFLQEFELDHAGKDIHITPGIKGWAESRGNSYWHVKYDSTCGHRGKYKDHGWEIASYVAKGSRELRSIAKAAQHLDRCGLEVTRNCGLHVHVNTKDFSTQQMGLLLARWIKIEPFLVSICSSRREDNPYCRSILGRYLGKDLLYDPEHLEDFYLQMRPDNFSSYNNSEKKYALNILGYTIYRIYEHHKRPTVELRLPECCLDERHVKNWTRLFLNFVDSCKTGPPPEDFSSPRTIQEVLKHLGLHGRDEFLLLDKGLLETKKWLLQKMSDSYRMPFEAAEWLAFISEF